MEVKAPNVPVTAVWKELVGLFVAFLVPIIFLIVDLRQGAPDWFQRSGVIAIAIVIVVEYRYMEVLQNKHI